MLKEFQEQQRRDHKQQWRDLGAGNKGARDRVYSESGAAIKEAAARHKAECRPIWAQFFREARNAERAFLARENSLAGVVRNAMDTTTHQKVSGQLGNRGVLAATFGNVLSSQARALAFAEGRDMSRAGLAQRLKTVLDEEIRTIKEQRGAALTTHRQAFEVARAVLIEKQDGERAKMREAWQQHYAARDRQRNPNYQARQDAVPYPEQKPMKKPFDDARRIEREQRPIATRTAFISQARPAPSPAGDVPQPAPKVAQTIPVKPEPRMTPAADKSPKRAFVDAATKKAPRDPQRDFSQAGKNSDPAPIKDAAYWQQRAKEARAAEKDKPARERGRDHDRER